MAFKVVGGPGDGLHVAAASGLFRWLDVKRAVGFARPAPGRVLYCRRGGRWEYAGAGAWACSCGVIVLELTNRCPLCGRPRRMDG